jgi:hypothetical protein
MTMGTGGGYDFLEIRVIFVVRRRHEAKNPVLEGPSFHYDIV